MNKMAGYRRALSMTQKDMAKFLDISLQSYWSKENGRVPFSDIEKVKIKDLLSPYIEGVTIDDIFFNNKVLKL